MVKCLCEVAVTMKRQRKNKKSNHVIKQKKDMKYDEV